MKKFNSLLFIISIIIFWVINPSAAVQSFGQDTDINNIHNKEELFKYYIDLGEKNWRTDKRKTDSLARLGLRIAQDTLINDSLLAEGYHLLGKTLIDVGDYQAGIDTLIRCIEIKEKAYGKNKVRSSRTYNYIGLGYYYSLDFTTATIYFNKAITVLKENNVFVPELFDTYMNLGILNKSIGEYSKAYYHLGRAKMVLDSLGTRADSVLIAQFYYNYGNLTTTNGKFKEALKYFNMSEAIFLKKFGPNHDWVGYINTSKGNLENYNENYNLALLHFHKALEIFMFHNLTKTGVPQSYYLLGEISIKLNDFQNAIRYCTNGLEYEPIPNTKVSLLVNLAISYSKIEENVKANDYFLLALEYAENKYVHPIKSINAYTAYADFLFGIHKFEESKVYYDIALKKVLKHQGKLNENYASLITQLGNYHIFYSGDLEQALNYFEESCTIWNEYFNIEDNKFSSLVPNEIDFISAYRGKARTLFRLYENTDSTKYLDESLRFYQIVLNRAELVNKNMDKENNYLLLERLKPVYEEAISVAFIKYNLTSDLTSFVDAFELAEMSKASVLLNSIQNNYALKTAEVPESVVDYEHQLTNEINGIKQLRAEEDKSGKGPSNKVSFYNSQLLDLMVKHDSLKEEIEQNYPKYYQLKFDRTIINLDTLLINLHENEAILEYALTDSALFIYIIRHDTVALHRIKIDDRFYNSLNALIEVKNSDIGTIGKSELSDYAWHASYLWECLIKPFYQQIIGKHLIIIPDGLLGYLPFEILVSPNEDQELNYFNQLPYLIKEFPVSYAYSSTLKYNSFFGNKQEAQAGLVSFSPSYHLNKDDNENRGNGLPDLPYSNEEAKTVKKIFGGKAYRNSKATKSRFVDESGEYQLIHLAMHALINDSLPMLSELVFAPYKNDTISNVLHTYEVFGLELTADLVTLSACNTGSGKLQTGEGIMSLARGFVYAGVPAIVMTLWEIQDKSGYEIMSSFYTYLKAGDTKDIALQKAKIDFLEQSNMYKSHPYFWSSYIISGDASTIKIKEKKQEWIYIIVGIVVVAIFLMIYIKRKSARSA